MATEAHPQSSPRAHRAGSRHKSPDEWVLALCKLSPCPYERLEVWAGSSAAARSLRLLATVSLAENDNDATRIYERLEQCAAAAGAKVVRISAFAPGARSPAELFLWPVAYVEPDDAGDDEMSATDARNLPAAYAGLLRQAYQHNERLQDTVAAQNTALLQHLMTENRTLREERAAMRADLLAAEQVAHQREDRAIEQARVANRERMLGEGALMVAQAAATHLAPKGDAGNSAVASATRRLVESLGGDQMALLAAALKPEQLVVLNSLLQHLAGDEKGASNGPA